MYKPNVIGPPPPTVIETEIQGDISLYDASTERVLVLNGTASDVWRLCDGEQTLDQIVHLLSHAYQMPSSRIRGEVTATIQRMAGEGFLPPL